MREKNLKTTFVKLAISLLLMLLVAVPVPAAQKLRASQLQNGQQIWMEAGYFDRRDANKGLPTGKESGLGEKAKPFLAEDILVATNNEGVADYDFESPQDGKAFLYARVRDFRGGGQSWFVVLNSDQEADRLIIDTDGAWGWKTGREGPLSKTALKKGKNTVKAIRREGDPGREALLDIIVVSTVEFAPTDDHFKTAKLETAVQAKGKLATRWSAIKSGF